jgi:predicted Zn-ribbon and HTH transcriptional regulator
MVRPRPSPIDDTRQTTVRQSIRAVLLDGPATCRDLSRLVGIREHDVPEELEHLARTVRASGERLVIGLHTVLASHRANL